LRGGGKGLKDRGGAKGGGHNKEGFCQLRRVFKEEGERGEGGEMEKGE